MKTLRSYPSRKSLKAADKAKKIKSNTLTRQVLVEKFESSVIRRINKELKRLIIFDEMEKKGNYVVIDALLHDYIEKL